MPDPRPLPSIRRQYFGSFDEPPASSDHSTPRTRRSRLHHALNATEDMAASDLAEMHVATRPPPPPPRGPPPRYAPQQRRRQRSPGFQDTRDPGSDDSMRRRSKRTRLDAEPIMSRKQPIKYGHYGQVEPGRLRLEIVSCDGGEHRDPNHPSTYLGPQNLLRHDKSVYCSERPSTSIVLCHADDTPFCLEKLHIVGPEHGFDAPVREGLVYVAMSMNDLQQYMDPPPHARLYGVHTPPYRRRRETYQASPERITLVDALRDPHIGAALDAREGRYASRAEAAHDLSSDHYYGHDSSFGRQDSEAHCEIPPLSDTADSPTLEQGDSFPITLLSDEEPGPEETSSQDVLDFRLRRLRVMRRRIELEALDRDSHRPRWPAISRGEDHERDDSWNLRRLDAMMARSRMADSPQHEDFEQRERDSSYTYGPDPGYGPSYYRPAPPTGIEYCDDGSSDPNVTRVRLQVRRGKHKVAIKFDPPVSGRFLLLKLWANRGNVDVQSVIAKGFGGSRFFPAVEFR